MLTLFYSNRFEALTEALLEGLSDAPGPWTRESVIVPSAAVRRRLELDIARRQGICANLDFTYLAQWIWARIGAVLPVPEHSPFSPDRLTWRCYRLLDPDSQRSADPAAGAASEASAPRLAAYLSGADDTMRYELARRVATVLDHYLTYRPEWLGAWQQGASIFTPGGEAARINPRLLAAGQTAREDEQWQAALWRQLLAEVGAAQQAGGPDSTPFTGLPPETPPAYRFLAQATSLDLDTVARAGWPDRVSVFALPTMPPLQIALLRELARWIDVRMYVFNPCREYWADILPEAQVDALAMREAADYHEVGNPLLAEWGRQTQAQLHMLQELTEGAAGREASYYEPNLAPTLLAACQNAILDLAPLPVWPPAQAAEHEHGSAADRGIEVHVCHSLSRQLEALHDRLLALFDAEPDLQPGEVMVAVPDLAGAAPLIDAVFGSAAQRRRIPYRISGLPPSRANPVARVLLDLLAATVESVAAPELIEWLRVEALATRHAIDAGELETVQSWLAAAGARRGLAAQTAAPDSQVAPARHTLADALLRLYLGYAMPDAADPVADCLPVAGAEGAQADLLGRLAHCVGQLEAFTRDCAVPRTAAQWGELLRTALATLFADQLPFSDSVAAVRDAIDSLAQVIEAGAANSLLSAGVMRAALAATLDDPARGGVPWGGVTFSALTSLRGLPFKVICLLDLNDGALPSVTRADEFDLIAAFPKLGDRQRRDDERNLFLDLLLAARSHLLVYFTGRSIRDNTPLPPAAMVDALLDHLALAVAGAGATAAQIRTARASLITEHPLQPFAAQYALGEAGLYTYDADRAQIAARLADGMPRHALPFFVEPLPPLPRGLDDDAAAASASGGAVVPALEIEFDQFERFWRHPVRTLLRDRLGVALYDAQAALAEREPFELDWAGRDALAQRVLPVLLEAGDGTALSRRATRIAAASPELPSAATGLVWRERALAGLGGLAEAVRATLDGVPQRVPFALTLQAGWPTQPADADDPFARDPLHALEALHSAGPVVLSGVLRDVSPHGLVLYRYARATARDYLSAWLHHLVLCASAPPGVARQTWWLGETGSFMLSPVAAPLARLAELSALYQVGLRTPLWFFPRSAWAQVATSAAEARSTWLGGPMSHGEVDDAYLQIALRALGDPGAALDPVFERLAQVVYRPLQEHLRDADGLR